MVESDKDAAQWLAEARAGSAEALGKALDNCRKYLLLIAGRQIDSDLHAKGGASDLVQETFLEAHRDFARFHGSSEDELLAWLRQILLNNVANFTRRYRTTGKREVGREVPLQPQDSEKAAGPSVPDPTRTPSSQAVEREQAEALQRALARLPDEYRRVIVHRYLEGRSFEEIGALMNRSADAARKLWARAMERLRQEWESLHGPESQ
jgi:RNA polymerase sigma-70 factor, ECF subfamily